MSDENKSLLKVNNLSVSFDTTEGSFDAVKAINFDLNKGETLALLERVDQVKALLLQ